ncbi:MAG TPA: ABC transporter ATP-binding protein [Chitinophagaceae bacterium]|nr:ABC transporter ATP-binding protein [Chitinophagaceae bacterium]
MALLIVQDVSKKEKTVFAVKDISFSQQLYQKIAIAGETGSGKTTLLKMIAGLVQPDAGEIVFEQKKLGGPNNQLIPGHTGIAYLSQHFELRNNYWVHEILSYANELAQEEADILYKVCRIDHLLNRRTDQLSGGEKQRIALARLLIGSPRLLLLDEPFSSLDAIHKGIIKAVIDDISAKLGVSCIMVSHDAPDILSWADTILVMKEGQLIQQGSPEQVYRQPVNEYCAGLLGEYNLVNDEDAALLNPSAAASSTQKKMLLRPEQFIINEGNNGLKGIVQNIFFMGSYYTIEVTTGRQLIKIKTSNNAFLLGETVQLSLSSAPAWYV